MNRTRNPRDLSDDAQPASRETLLVKSKMRGKAVLHTTHLKAREIEYLSPVTLTPMALEIGHRDLTNRVNRVLDHDVLRAIPALAGWPMRRWTANKDVFA
jgi:hypothetical protein